MDANTITWAGVPMNLRSILLAMAILAFLTAGVGGAFYYNSLVGSSLKEAESQTRIHVATVRNFIRSFFSENIKSVKILAGLKDLQAACADESPGSLKTANGLLDHFKRSLDADACYLMNRAGLTIASSNRHDPDSFIGRNYAFRPYFINARAGKPDTYFALGVTSKKRGVYFSHPVYAPPEIEPAGVAVIKISLDVFEQNLKGLKQSENEITMLTSPEGIIIASDKISWLNHFLWKNQTAGNDQNDDKEIDADQFGEGPWPWTGLTRNSGRFASNSSGIKYLYDQEPVYSLEGWHIVHLRNIDSLYQRLIAPLFEVAGILIIASALLVGFVVVFLYKRASADLKRRKRLENKLLQLSQALEQSPVSVVITDTKGTIEYVNPKFSETTGYSRSEVVGKNPRVLQSGKMPSDFYKKLWNTILSGRIWSGEFINTRKSGEQFWEKATISPIKDKAGRTTHFVGIKEDISELKKADRQLRNSLKFFQQLIDVIPTPVFYKDHKGHYRGCNKPFEAFAGVKRQDIVGKTVYDLLSKDLADKFHAKDLELLSNPGIQVYESEIKSADGVRHHVLFNKATFSDPDGSIGGIVGVMMDITERKKNEEQITHLALHDNLTGLPNRYLFFDRLQHAIGNADRNRSMVALLYFDLDGFKEVNDQFGHMEGDHVLKEIGSRLIEVIRATDTVARIGGDEFAIILPDLKIKDPAADIARKIIHSISRAFDIRGQAVCVGASIGISIYPEHAADAEEMVHKADAAMYQVKNKGKGDISFYTGN